MSDTTSMMHCKNTGCQCHFKWPMQLARHKKKCTFPAPESITRYEKAADGMFKCSTCSKSFKHQSGVIKHLKKEKCDTQSGEPKEHDCPHCPAVFKFRCRLLEHMKNHRPENDKTCSSCGKEFKRKDHFQKHVNSCSK